MATNYYPPNYFRPFAKRSDLTPRKNGQRIRSLITGINPLLIRKSRNRRASPEIVLKRNCTERPFICPTPPPSSILTFSKRSLYIFFIAVLPAGHNIVGPQKDVAALITRILMRGGKWARVGNRERIGGETAGRFFAKTSINQSDPVSRLKGGDPVYPRAVLKRLLIMLLGRIQ